MKRKFLCAMLLALCSAALLQAAAPRIYDAKMPRRIQIARNIAMVMVQNGKVNFEIVYGPTRAAKYAAQEAAAVLGKTFGTVIKPKAKASGKVPAIIIGDKELAAKNGIDVKKFDRDGFAIRTIGNNVLIVGDDDNKDPLKHTQGYGLMAQRGSLFGTYDFLERFADARFYFPGEMGTVTVPMKDWRLPTINIYDRPDFLQRNISCGPAVFNGLPKGSNAINFQRLRLSTIVIPNCHGLAVMQFIQRFAKSNPEYFALQENGLRHFDTKAARPSSRKGHICFSSDIKKVIIEDAVAFLNKKDAKTRGMTHWSWSRHPAGMPYFNIMPNDCCYPCQCAQCKPYFSKGYKAGSDFIWQFFVDIANEVKKRNAPGCLTTMAYANYRAIPPFDIPDNLLVMLALRGPWNALNPKAHQKDMALLKAWTDKLKGKTWLWTYPHKLHIDPGIPNYAPRAVGNFYKECAPHIFGAYMEAETDVYLFSALNYYVYSRVAWDNQTDVDGVIKEYFRKMYGKAAPEMEQISVLLENKWLSCVGRSVETPEGPKTFFPSTIELWTKFYGDSFSEQINALFDKAEKNARSDKAALKRIQFMRKELWGKLAAARAGWERTVSAKDHWNAVMPEGQWSKPIYLLPLRKKGKIGKPEVRTAVYMKHDAGNYYFKFDCEEPHTDKIVAPKRERDYSKLWNDNTVEVQLDPAGEGKERYQFIISSSGAVQDIRISNKFHDPKWNTRCTSKATAVPGKGFVVELTVPRKDLPAAVPGKFKANFNRYRVLNGVECMPFYTWSVFAKSFGDQENFGTILFEENKLPQVVKDGDFTSKVTQKRWLGRWFSNKALTKDTSVFVHNGESVRLVKEQHLAQFVKFKPDTEYVLSFWVKLAENSGFNVRVDENSGIVRWLPTQKMLGPQEWIRQEFRFKTGKKMPGKKSYIRFQTFGKECSVWISKAELYEVKK